MTGPAAAWPALTAVRPVLPLLGTMLAYEAGLRLQRLCRGNALANPVLFSVAVVAVVLTGLDGSPEEYAAGVKPLALLLGPATVALAVPLHRSLPRIRAALVPVLAGIGAGAVTAAAVAVVIAGWLGAPGIVLHSIVLKSTTAAIAMAVAPLIGGDPALAAGLAVLTGITGAVMCTWVLDLAGVHDQRARGLATGITAHGIGTARMLAIDAEAGAFSSLGMALGGFAGGILLPVAYAWLGTSQV